MAQAPWCDEMGLKKGPWTPEEDRILISYIKNNGHGKWLTLPKQAGLRRCGKSCRLRWKNYLRPDIKRGNFSLNEEQTIIQLHRMLGNRWSTIASHLPGRTDNEIKNVWHTRLKKRLLQTGVDLANHVPRKYNVSTFDGAVGVCDSHEQNTDHQFQSRGCTSQSVKKEGNSSEPLARQSLQETKALEEQGVLDNSPQIQKTPDDQNNYCNLNSGGNNYSYSSRSSRVLPMKPLKLVSASPLGLCTAIDHKQQNNSEKLTAPVMPFDYIKTGEKKLPAAVDYTSLQLQSSNIDSLKLTLDNGEVNWNTLAGNQQNFVSLGCGEFQENDRTVVQQAYQESNLAYNSSTLSLWSAAENNILGDQAVAYSFSNGAAATVSDQQKTVKPVKVEPSSTDFSVEPFLELADHSMGTNMESKGNIYDRWPEMNLVDQDDGMEYWFNFMRQVGSLPFVQIISPPDL